MENSLAGEIQAPARRPAAKVGPQPIRYRMGAALLRLVLFLSAICAARAVDPTWNYAVQATATVTATPPSITLTWVEDTTPNSSGYHPSYAVYRKARDATQWGPAQNVPVGRLSFTDTDVTPGNSYEYQIVRTYRDPAAPDQDHLGYGYLLSGIDVALPDQRGKAILVVENTVATGLADRIQRLRSDLVADGWTTAQIDVAATDAPAHVQALIRAEANSTGIPAEAVILLGHVPVARAGNYAPDGHDPRSMPCDSFYGDLDGTWVDANQDGVYDSDTIASDIELEVGRIDFSGLTELPTNQSELDLTAQYLDKDHAFRQAQTRFSRRALIGDRIGYDYGRNPAAAGYRAFSAMFGPSNIVAAVVEDDTPDAGRWLTLMQGDAFAWAFGSGGGAYDQIAFLGADGQYHAVTSAEIAANGRAGFYLLFGSFLVEWDQPNDFLRAALASRLGGLGAGWSGRPSFIFHRLALGETIGAGVRLTQNNDGLFFSPDNAFRRGVHIAWMGDPTLRMDYVAPPTALAGTRIGTVDALSWQPSADATETSIRYLVYRGASPDGPFDRLTPTPIAELAFTDGAATGQPTYAVKAVALQQTASGTYENTSEAATWTDGSSSAPPSSTPSPSPARTSLSDANIPVVPALIVKGPAGALPPADVGPFSPSP